MPEAIDQLSPGQVQQYREHGYVVAESLFDADDLARVDAAVNELTQQALGMEDASSILEFEPEPVDGRPTPRRIYNPFHQHANFNALATDDRLLDRLEQLIGPDIHIQHSKLNMKPARVGSAVEWHQDLTYFPHTNDNLVTLLIYLDDATEANGCLRVLPGLHHGYLDHALPDGRFAGMITEPVDDGRYGQPVSLEAPAGSVIFMHCLTPHSSLPNTSDHGRRTLIFEYRAADALPIYFGELCHKAEKLARQVRGHPARFARFGNIAPLIPAQVEDNVTSLYDLQQRAKQRMAAKA